MAEAIERTDAEKQKILALMKGMHLFKGLDNAALEKIIARLVTRLARTEERLFAEREFAESFFIILEGHVQITRVLGKDETYVVANMVRGDYFGEVALINRALRTGEARAKVPTTLLEMSLENFQWMLQEFPSIRKDLQRIISGYEVARRKKFKWLRPDETIHVLARRDFVILLAHLIGPILVGILSLWALTLSTQVESSFLFFLGATGSVVSVGWGIWTYVDWENDYYVVTDKRVVYVEKIILLYDSIQEAPLETIQTIRLSSGNAIQRWFGYGDVQVDTYGGRIIMKQVRDPGSIEDALNEYWDRTRTTLKLVDNERVRKEVRQRLGLETIPKTGAAPAPAMVAKPAPPKSFLNDFLQVRVVEDDIITYRKHWFILLRKIWPVLLLLAFIIGLMITSLLGMFALFTVTQLLTALLFVLVFSSPYWIYQYWDWRDDQYQLTNREVIDYDKKPFLAAKKRVAPLDHILSIEHSRRGILSLLLNFGTVNINAGNESLTFDDIYNPANVQSEISEASFRYKNNKKTQEEKSQRDHVEKLVDVYAEYLPQYLEKKQRENAEQDPEG
jgi:hypothetical protein